MMSEPPFGSVAHRDKMNAYNRLWRHRRRELASPELSLFVSCETPGPANLQTRPGWGDSVVANWLSVEQHVFEHGDDESRRAE